MRDPRPKDWDAYCAALASGDANRVAAAKATYNQELIEAGRSPMFEQPELWKEE